MTFKPHIIQSNNGAEFKNFDTIAWYKENNITYIFTQSYSPESNGLIKILIHNSVKCLEKSL